MKKPFRIARGGKLDPIALFSGVFAWFGRWGWIFPTDSQHDFGYAAK
ncbi:MAG: hypothetical protein KGS61_15455 [Verrucomicrobia bacterium]|nr:hypothetical protein [Verrucomicrobiota bacterium]